MDGCTMKGDCVGRKNCGSCGWYAAEHDRRVNMLRKGGAMKYDKRKNTWHLDISVKGAE